MNYYTYLKYFLCLFFVVMSGCGFVLANRNSETDDGVLFGGIIRDTRTLYNLPKIVESEQNKNLYWYYPLLVLDTPISLVCDIAALPFMLASRSLRHTRELDAGLKDAGLKKEKEKQN